MQPYKQAAEYLDLSKDALLDFEDVYYEMMDGKRTFIMTDLLDYAGKLLSYLQRVIQLLKTTDTPPPAELFEAVNSIEQIIANLRERK